MTTLLEGLNQKQMIHIRRFWGLLFSAFACKTDQSVYRAKATLQKLISCYSIHLNIFYAAANETLTTVYNTKVEC